MADVTGPPAPAVGRDSGCRSPELSGPTPAGPGSIDRSEQPGRVGLLLVLAGLLVGAAIGLSFVANEQAQPLIVWLLALLAMAGVFFLFALAIGALQLSGQRGPRRHHQGHRRRRAGRHAGRRGRRPPDLRQRGLSADRRRRHLLEPRAGRAHLRRLAGGLGGDLPPGAGLARRPQRIPRRSGCRRRSGRARRARLRLVPRLGAAARAAAPAPPRSGRSPTSPRERERQENVFQELQHAIDYLDHAPAGFLSIDPAGAIVYMNATLAAWLGYDLAKVGPGGLHLTEIAPGRRDVLVRTAGPAGRGPHRPVRPRPAPPQRPHRCRCGSTTASPSARTASRARRAPSCSTARPGPRPTSRSAPPRCASPASSTTRPIAIATLDRDRPDRPGQRLVRPAVRRRAAPGDDGAIGGDGRPGPSPTSPIRSSATAPPSRPASPRAASGLADIEPIEVLLSGPGSRSARVWLSPADGERPGAADRRGRAA